MKILFLNTFYRNGGAARSTERIFNSIKKINEQTFFITQYNEKYYNKDLIKNTLINKLLARIKPIIEQVPLIFYRKRKNLFHFLRHFYL